MFSGSSHLNLDNKNRMTFPSRYRELLMEHCYGEITCTVDLFSKCILLYPQPQWQEISCKLMKLSDTQSEQRAVKRLLLGHAQECQLDKNGRVLLPNTLRDYAHLTKHVILVGQLNKFELWDEALWQAEVKRNIDLVSSLDLSRCDNLNQFSL